MLRYREAFHLSSAQMDDEPIPVIKQTLLIWSLDSQRAKLDLERQKTK
jgi:hypothetical protein